MRTVTLSACALFCASALFADPPSPSRQRRKPRITILTEGAGDLDLEPLRKAISAHLSPYAVDVEIVEAFPAKEEEPMTPAEIAKRVLVARDAMAVVWIDAESNGFSAFVVDADTGGWTLERSLPEDRGAWIASCDGLASLLHAALLPGLGVAEDYAQKPEATASRHTEEGNAAVTRAKEEAEAKRRRPRPTGALGVLVNVGYGPLILNKRGDVQHGARLAVGTSFARGFELVIGLDLLFPFEAGSDAPGTGIRLVRWPFRVAPGWSYSFNKVHLGARIGFVVDSSSIHGLDESATVIEKQDTERVNPGLMSSIRLRVDLIEEFSFFMEITADIYSRSFTYTWGGRDVLEYGAIQTSLVAGCSVQFDVI